MNWSGETITVFGGSGFLGGRIVRQLIELNCGKIKCFNRSPVPALEKAGVEIIRGDIREGGAVNDACKGATAVIHTSAKAGIWGSWKEYYGINVEGTMNVLAACKFNDIHHLVYTSSPSVAYQPNHDVNNLDESAAYPETYLSPYPATKAIAEKKVLGAPDKELSVIALRPHLLWGPGDPHLLPRIVRRAAAGKLTRIGDGHNIMDLTYIDNAVFAHLKAMEYLKNCEQPRRKVFFISDNIPVRIWEWLNELLEKLSIPPVTKSMSYEKAYRAGLIFETIYRLIPFLGEPPITRFVAGQLAYSHYFNISAAVNELGYRPIVIQQVAMNDTVEWLKKYVL